MLFGFNDSLRYLISFFTLIRDNVDLLVCSSLLHGTDVLICGVIDFLVFSGLLHGADVLICGVIDLLVCSGLLHSADVFVHWIELGDTSSWFFIGFTWLMYFLLIDFKILLFRFLQV